MSAKTIRFILLAILIAGAVSYTFYLNPHGVLLNLGTARSVEAPMALILVVVFSLGLLLASFIGVIVGASFSLANRRLSRELASFNANRSQIVKAREQLVAGNYDASRNILQKIIDKDESDVVARILLAETYQKQGDLNKALKVIDEARASQQKNVELLIVATELNLALGNNTAAHDNMSLVLQKDPNNALALSYLIRACEGLEQYDDALVFQRQLIRHPALVSEEVQDERQKCLARLEVRAALKRFGADKVKLRETLRDILVRHRNFGPALYELGILAREAADLEAASKHFSDAYRATADVNYLDSLARTWLSVDNPQRAVSSVRNLINEKRAEPFHAKVYFTCLLIHLDDIESALEEREKLQAGEDSEHLLNVLDAVLLRRSGEAEEAFDSLFDTTLDRQFPGYSLLVSRLATNARQGTDWVKRAREKLLAQNHPAARHISN